MSTPRYDVGILLIAMTVITIIIVVGVASYRDGYTQGSKSKLEEIKNKIVDEPSYIENLRKIELQERKLEEEQKKLDALTKSR